ncbi:hypothetical protein [Haladaptatus sp. CMAA 1911]|uniref:hypothetical protein n=1 Tax=unclassified Haladaptatus TaxID=2622732 RepID=UPI003754E7AB
MPEIGIKTCPGSTGVTRPVQTPTARCDILLTPLYEYVMDIIMYSITTFCPRFTVVVTDMDAANLDACDNAVRRIRMSTQTANMRFVAVARQSPLVT